MNIATTQGNIKRVSVGFCLTHSPQRTFSMTVCRGVLEHVAGCAVLGRRPVSCQRLNLAESWVQESASQRSLFDRCSHS